MKTVVRTALQAAVGGLALLAAIVWLSGGCGERIEPGEAPPLRAEAPPPGQVAQVEALPTPLFEEAAGTVSSARHTTIASKLLARIEEVRVRAGSEVAEGQAVVRLDSRDLEARARAAREAVASTRAELALRRSERQRVADLRRREVATPQDLERADTALRVAESNLEQALQQLNDAEVSLSFAEIRSPVSGRVVDRLAEPGDMAVPGTPLLRIYDPGALRLEVPVRESLALRLRPGQTLQVRIEAIDLRLEGEIDEIVPYAEPGARTFLVKVRLPADIQIYAGMFGRVAVPAGEGRQLRLPAAAVERIGQLEFVRVVQDDGRVERRLVTTGGVDREGRVEVLSGLTAGERVVLPGRSVPPPAGGAQRLPRSARRASARSSRRHSGRSVRSRRRWSAGHSSGASQSEALAS